MSTPLTTIRMPSHPPHLDRGEKGHPGPEGSAEQAGAVPHPDRAELSRHSAAVHISGIAKRRSIAKPAAAGVVLLAVVGIGVWQLDRFAAEASAEQALASADARSISTRRAQRAEVALDDGSRVVLGAQSLVRVVPEFGQHRRLLGLEGAAEFQVVSGRHPFQVKVGSVSITATGTIFAVTAWSPREPALVRVQEGAVTIRGGEQSTELAAGGAIAVEPSGATREPTAVELEEAFAWVAGNVSVVQRPLREALAIARRWYGLEITVEDSTLLDRQVSASAPIESSRRFLDEVQASGKLYLHWIDKEMVLRATPPARRSRR